jgi:hypothetical protein
MREDRVQRIRRDRFGPASRRCLIDGPIRGYDDSQVGGFRFAGSSFCISVKNAVVGEGL